MNQQSRRSFNHLGMLALALLLVGPLATAFAGMPMPLPDKITTIFQLGEEPERRLQVISFFMLGLLCSALMVKLLWNGLRREFTRLPRLSYGKSLLITVAWGLLFCIVLVMISGARELMTPGAWRKDGATYQLNQPPAEEELP